MIYKIENLINGKIYIGKAKEFSARKRCHLCDINHGRGYYLHDAVRKYGIDNFSWEIIAEMDNSLLSSAEIKYIEYYNSCDPEQGYNLTKGGEGQLGRIPSVETRQKRSTAVSKSLKGHAVSEETRKKISEKLKGKCPEHMTDKFKKRLSDRWLKDNPMYNEEQKAKAFAAKGSR